MGTLCERWWCKRGVCMEETSYKDGIFHRSHVTGAVQEDNDNIIIFNKNQKYYKSENESILYLNLKLYIAYIFVGVSNIFCKLSSIFL